MCTNTNLLYSTSTAVGSYTFLCGPVMAMDCTPGGGGAP